MSTSGFRAAMQRGAFTLAALLLAACGGGGSSPPAAVNGPPTSGCADCGTTFVAITDADGDFLSYTVDVTSLKLRKANGTLVETLPASTRIDFAQLVDLTEFFTAATIPNGEYVAATLRLDYTNADIAVEQNGAPVAARALDAGGNPLGAVDVTVTLDNRHHLFVSAGRPSLFTLDFNLAATNSVDLTTNPATVTVTPALVASLDFVDQKDMRVRGPLVSVDKTAGTYVVDLRPFHERDQRFGEVTVHTDASTTFEINGANYTGSAGLDALNAAGAGTVTAAFGTLTPATREFEAASVVGGTSVPGAGVDTVMGEVLSRAGDVLTVRGGTVVRNDGAHFARGTVKVTIGPDTRVVKGGTSPAMVAAPADISVGQSIEAFGAATPVVSSSLSGDWSLDATKGRVRLRPTSIYGFVRSASTGALTLQLDSIAGRKAAAFDFTGTGTSPAMDADPANYEIEATGLSLSGLSTGEPTKLIGFPTPFGLAPPDFAARTLVDFPRLPAMLSLTWIPGGTPAPFASQNPAGLVLDTTNPAIGRLHVLCVGPRVLNLQTMPASPAIVPPVTGPTAYLIVMHDESHAFHDFADFVAELGTRLNGSTVMLTFNATGNYDGDTNTLTARSITVILK